MSKRYDRGALTTTERAAFSDALGNALGVLEQMSDAEGNLRNILGDLEAGVYSDRPGVWEDVKSALKEAADAIQEAEDAFDSEAPDQDEVECEVCCTDVGAGDLNDDGLCEDCQEEEREEQERQQEEGA